MFHHNPKNILARQLRHIKFISQFTTDIRHISGDSNVVADALSRPETELISATQLVTPFQVPITITIQKL